MCRYGDIRRTVALQDRGMIHAHGNVQFDELISYGYNKTMRGYIHEVKREGKCTSFITKEIDLEQCSFVVAIPREMKTTDKEIFCGPRRRFEMEYARNSEELRVGAYQNLMGRPIDPKYIIGYYMNKDISSFKYNSKFYGFKECEKESETPELDLEKIQQENKKIKQKNAERAANSTQELGKETIKEQENTGLKRKGLNLLTRLKSLIKKSQNKMRDD